MEREKEATKALALLLLLAAAGSTYGRYVPEDVEVTFNLDEKPLSELLDTLRAILIKNRPRLIIAGGVYLAPKIAKRGSPPGRFLKITLVSGSARTTVAIEDGNLYLLGFRNMGGEWHCFPDFASLFHHGRSLPFTENYTELYEGHKNLVNVLLGKAAAIAAVNILSDYDASSTPVEDVKLALTTLMLTISEALRFKSVRRAITDNWEGQTSLSEHQASYLIVSWGNISYCLFLWETKGRRWVGRKECLGAKRAEVNSMPEALAAVDLFMRPQVISINSTAY